MGFYWQIYFLANTYWLILKITIIATMNTSLLDWYRTDTILANASQEWGEWMRLLAAWCTELRNQDTNTISHFFEKFYKIHEKIHHRAILILACTIDDPTSITALKIIHNLDNRFLREQERIKKMFQSLRSKTFFWGINIAYNTKNYMKDIHGIINDIELDWSVLPSWWLIYDPVDTLADVSD